MCVDFAGGFWVGASSSWGVFEEMLLPAGMAWGLLLVAPFLGKLRVHYEMQLFAEMLGWWDVLCIEHWWIRHGYLAGVMLGAGLMWRRRRSFQSGSGDGEEDVLRAAGVSERTSRDALFRRASLP